MTPNEGEHAPVTSETLARRLNLLLDMALAEKGTKLSYNDIRDAMDEAGTPISRARWFYLRKGSGHAITDFDLLKNLSKFFGVNEDYLVYEDETVPERVEAQLDLLASMRANNVRNFAARQLDGIAPETLVQIRDLIDQHLAEHNRNAG